MISHFDIPSSVVCGAGVSRELVPQLKRIGARRILLVSDAYMVSSGLVARFEQDLRTGGIEPVAFTEVLPDPTDENVRAGVRVLKSGNCDAVVALGGGSPMDAAKAICVLATNGEPLSRCQGYHRIDLPGLPLIVIPTTAGTGSEVTKVAVITDTERGVKMMMLDRHLLPTVALVDYELTLTMPAALTAHVGVDTLTHAMEAYVSRKATPLTDPLALQCIHLVSQHLETAWRQPDHRPAREGMMLAATLGGMAFANSSVALVHGMSRPVGALFHIPHGLSNALLLPAVTRFSLVGATDRYATISRTLGCASQDMNNDEAAATLVPALIKLNQSLQVPSLSQCAGVTRSRFDEVKAKMAADALDSGSPANNPVVPGIPEIIRLYEEAW